MLLYPFRYVWWLIRKLRRSVGRPPEFVLLVIEGDLPELPDPRQPLWRRPFSRPRLSLQELGERLDAIGRDPRIRGVVLHLMPLGLPLASLETMREMVARLRAAGKRVVAWAPFYTTGTYFLACACDEVLLLPSGSVMPLGFTRTGTFLAEGLARFGIVADFVQISPFKTAADPLTRTRMSDEFREQVTWLVEAQHGELLSAIQEGRAMDAAAAKDVVDGSPYGDELAATHKVVDGIVAEEDLARRLAAKGSELASVGGWQAASRKLSPPRPRLGRGPYVALMSIEGVIMDGRSGALPVKPPIEVPIVGDRRAGDLTVAQVARLIAADRRAAAAIVYVDSRGGSSSASEAMRQAIAAIAARKPVVVAMGPVAGSGGYWVATPASWIVARPSTLTGSIGVLTGKVALGGLWSKLLFNRETISRGEHAMLEGDDDPYTEDERAIIRAEVERIYDLFLKTVAGSRKMSLDDLKPSAGGRVWTGRQALQRRLVDELGGLEAAAAKARELAHLSAKTPVRVVRPQRREMAPTATDGVATWFGYWLAGLSRLGQAPALALLDYLPPRVR